MQSLTGYDPCRLTRFLWDQVVTRKKKKSPQVIPQIAPPARRRRAPLHSAQVLIISLVDAAGLVIDSFFAPLVLVERAATCYRAFHATLPDEMMNRNVHDSSSQRDAPQMRPA